MKPGDQIWDLIIRIRDDGNYDPTIKEYLLTALGVRVTARVAKNGQGPRRRVQTVVKGDGWVVTIQDFDFLDVAKKGNTDWRSNADFDARRKEMWSSNWSFSDFTFHGDQARFDADTIALKML